MLNMRDCEEMRSENYAKKKKEKVLRREAKKLIIGKRFILIWRGFSFILFFIFCQKLINGSRLNSHFTALLFFIVISIRFFIFSFQWKIHQTFTLSFVLTTCCFSYFLFVLSDLIWVTLQAICRLLNVFHETFPTPSQLFPFHSLFISSWNIHNFFYLDFVFAISWETFLFVGKT